jgi:poly[(R)-3-hydroxyalkanoate] polymerase subunit PhaC
MTSTAAEPADLARAWADIGAQWMQWWTRASQGAIAVETPAPPLPLPGIVDLPARAALDARYQPQWEALWRAAQSVLIGAKPSLPEIVATPAGDHRFAGRAWRELPYFSLLRQSYLLASAYLTELAGLAEVPEADRRRLAFLTRQYLDAISPTNFAATNPEVLERALTTEGLSLAQGVANLAGDLERGRISMTDESAFAIGHNLAVTPGHVVYRNELIELIQYAPTTKSVHRRPLVIVPPCINKYYILDLQPENSFVRWAVGRGHTVFIISWRNIPPELGRLTWDAYIEQGALTAMRVAKEIAGSATINVLGFCVGGTMLACALAVLAARRDRSVQSATFLTTMLDFTDPGDIGVYVSRELLAAREPALMSGERIHGRELAAAFASLRANELVWNYVVRNYLKGETPPAFDLLYWNGDSANLPGPMYVYYLRNLYLDNRLVEPGALTMLGERIDLSAVTVPTYVYASRDDHIVPWRSGYRTTSLLRGDLRFVLGASGHIAGVINPPDKHRRNYWTNDLITDDADDWFVRADRHPGSWWPDWADWLQKYGGAKKPAPREAGTASYPPLDAAPGRYVLETADASGGVAATGPLRDAA